MMRALSTIAALLFLLPCFGQGQSGRPMVSVDTVADLVARNPVPNERVLLSGLRTAGDFGAQRIVRHVPASVAATNLGCVYKTATTGRYLAEDCDSGEVDVRWFGAIEDDGVEDTTAIQAAIQQMEVVSGIVKFPRGTFDVDRLYITNASLLGAGFTYGTVDGDSTKVRTALQHKVGATGHMLNVERSTGGNFIRGFDLLGHRELNLVNPKAIVSASTRTNFVVASADVPSTPQNVSAFPYYGFAFFYSSTSNYLGHALISGVTTNTGAIEIRYGWDNYATTAGLLTSSELVCFSPLESASGYFTDRASPTAAGWAGINITRTVSQGIVCKIEDVKVIRFHTGIRVVAGSGIDYDNVWCQANTFAGIATAVPAYGSDDHGNRVYCQGFYASDVGNTDPNLNSWTDEYYRSTAFGLYAPSSRGVWLDFSSSRNVINVLDSLSSDLYFGYILADVPIKHGWLTVNGRSGSLDGGVDIGYICVSTPYYTLPTGMVYENGVDRCAIGVVNNDSLIRRLSIRTLSVGRFAGAPAENDFASAVSIPQWTATTNRVSIGAVVNKDGATNLVASGRAANFSDPNWFITPAERKFGILADQDTDDLLIAADSAANIRINSTTITSSNVVALYRSDASPQITFNRTGSSAFGLLPSGESLIVRDGTLGASAMAVFSSATQAGIQLGEISGTPRTPAIYGTTASGTNVAATSLLVYGPAGTGNSTPATIRFITADVGTSGTAAQSRTLKAEIGSGMYVGGTAGGISSVAILQADSTTKGFLPPRMTTTQRDAILSPDSGLTIFNTTSNRLQFWDGAVWYQP